ncbi:MAG: type II toxin-antitoxin system HigB family toxin [Candidatus Obscuribacterales bacterium]|nr:type II toxin-antitoxin system HigB family toxin [Candidatus Obscuribacterales bacterium]
MILENKRGIVLFVAEHPEARMPFRQWVQKVEGGIWRNFTAVRKTFNSADYVKGLVVFNDGGNNWRVLTQVVFKEGIVRVLKVGSHSDYLRWKL